MHGLARRNNDSGKTICASVRGIPQAVAIQCCYFTLHILLKARICDFLGHALVTF